MGTVITNKKPDEVIKSFFDNPKQFSSSPNNNVSGSGGKKFQKMSQKERKKQLLKDETSPPIPDNKPKWTGWGDQTNGKVSLASIMKSEENAAQDIITKESPNNNIKTKSASTTTNVKRV